MTDLEWEPPQRGGFVEFVQSWSAGRVVLQYIEGRVSSDLRYKAGQRTFQRVRKGNEEQGRLLGKR